VRELLLDVAEHLADAGVAPVERARAEVEVGLEPAEAQHWRGVAVVGVCLGERVVQRLDRGGDGVRVGALVEQEAADRARVRRCGYRAAERLEAADRLQQRQRLAVARVVAACARRPVPPTKSAGCEADSVPSSPGGSATRSIRSIMSAASIRAPASRNACASSRSIVLPVTPQNRPQRSFT